VRLQTLRDTRAIILSGLSRVRAVEIIKPKPFLSGLSRVRKVEIIQSKIVFAVFQTMMDDVSQFLTQKTRL